MYLGICKCSIVVDPTLQNTRTTSAAAHTALSDSSTGHQQPIRLNAAAASQGHQGATLAAQESEVSPAAKGTADPAALAAMLKGISVPGTAASPGKLAAPLTSTDNRPAASATSAAMKQNPSQATATGGQDPLLSIAEAAQRDTSPVQRRTKEAAASQLTKTGASPAKLHGQQLQSPQHAMSGCVDLVSSEDTLPSASPAVQPQEVEVSSAVHIARRAGGSSSARTGTKRSRPSSVSSSAQDAATKHLRTSRQVDDVMFQEGLGSKLVGQNSYIDGLQQAQSQSLVAEQAINIHGPFSSRSSRKIAQHLSFLSCSKFIALRLRVCNTCLMLNKFSHFLEVGFSLFCHQISAHAACIPTNSSPPNTLLL